MNKINSGLILPYSFLFLIAFTGITKPICAQNPFEPYFGIGLSGGVSNYLGDLNSHLSYRFSQLGVGAHFTCVFSKHLSAKINFYNCNVESNDKSGSGGANINRNLAFRSAITEVGAQVVYNLFGVQAGYLARARYTPYVFAGIGIFHFNPQDSIHGKWVDLQPLGTEGQTMHNSAYPEQYSLTQICIPFGIGFEYKFLNGIDIGAEIGFRKTFTDYIDDVSGYYPDETLLRANVGNLSADLSDRTLRHNVKYHSPRGDPLANDMYFYTNIHFTYYFYWTIFGGRFSGSKHSGDCWSFPR